MKSNNKTEIISKILTPAFKFWLRSQLNEVEDLEIDIHAGDTEILRGKVGNIFLKTTRAVYQDIHVRKVEIATENIGINLGGIVRGKPLRLLQPIFVKGELIATENDLNTSLSSSLLSQGLTDLVKLLLEKKGFTDAQEILKNHQFTWHKLNLNENEFILKGTITDFQGSSNSLILSAGLELYNPQTLLLNPIYIEGLPNIENFTLNELIIDLGSDVELEKLNLFEQELYCTGKVKINNE